MSPMPAQDYSFFKGKRVLVTGGTGFLGSHLVKKLLDLRANIYLLVRPTSYLTRIADVLSSVELIRGDLRVRKTICRAVEVSRPDIIFHLAAYGVSPKTRNPSSLIKTNVLGLTYLLDSLKGRSYEKFINTGTCFEYGNHKTRISEDHAIHPLNLYAASKTAAWYICNLNRNLCQKPIVTLRPFTFFGPFERVDRLIPSTVLSIFEGKDVEITSGVQTRDYTYVEDIVDAFLKAAVSEKAIGQTINLGSGKDYSVKKIVKQIMSLMKAEVRLKIGALSYREDEAWRLCCNNSKALTLLGWRPRVTFDEGLRKTIQWFRENAFHSSNLRSSRNRAGARRLGDDEGFSRPLWA